MNNQEIAQQMIDAWDQNNTEALTEIYHEDAVDHWGPEGLGSTYTGINKIIAAETRFHEGFPDYSMELLQVTSNGDRLAIHWRITGTHDGEFMGIPPTGNSVTYDGMVFHRIEDGKIAESWWVTDRLRLLREIDAVPDDETLVKEASSETEDPVYKGKPVTDDKDEAEDEKD